jgi:hypothetical protein
MCMRLVGAAGVGLDRRVTAHVDLACCKGESYFSPLFELLRTFRQSNMLCFKLGARGSSFAIHRYNALSGKPPPPRARSSVRLLALRAVDPVSFGAAHLTRAGHGEAVHRLAACATRPRLARRTERQLTLLRPSSAPAAPLRSCASIAGPPRTLAHEERLGQATREDKRVNGKGSPPPVPPPPRDAVPLRTIRSRSIEIPLVVKTSWS